MTTVVSPSGRRSREAWPASRIIARMQIDVTVPVTVGILFFLILFAGLMFVRQVGKSRPHSKTDD